MLFHRVILMSGSALSPWAVVKDASAATLKVAKTFNCSTTMSNGGGSDGEHPGTPVGGRTLLQVSQAFFDAFPAPRDPKSADFSSFHLEF